MTTTSEYDLKVVIRYLVKIALAALIWKVTSGVGAVIVTFWVLMSLLKDKPIEMMFWVMFITFTSCGNRNFFVTNVVSMVIVRATLLVLSGLLSLRLLGGGREARLMTPFWGIMAYVAWEFIVSAQGFQPVVSYLKLVLFLVVFLAMYGVANLVNRSTRANARTLRSAVLAVLSFVILGSMALIPFPSMSLMVDKAAIEAMLAGEVVSLFQGMSSHSQVLGPLMGVLGTFVFADLAFSIKKWDKLYLLLLVCCPYLCYKTSSRTGMGTMIAGIGMATLMVMKARGLGTNWKSKLVSTIGMFSVVAVIAAAAVPGIRNAVAKYALKWTKDAPVEVRMEDMLSSRQAAIDEAVMNFKKNPILGNGFQVSSDMVNTKRESLASYLSAPIEKGVWIYAIPEEGGVVGMFLFCTWLVVLFFLLIKRHAYTGASVFFAFMVSNMGEFSLFSTSYVGGFFWTLTFAAICLDVLRMKSTNMQVFSVPIDVVREEVGVDMWTKQLG